MTKDTPLVSIVIPTYNRHEKLRRLLVSIHKVTYSNIEIIVVNDFPKDTNYKKIEKDFKKVHFIHNNKELLLAGSRNTGIAYSAGDYILLVDDDNVVSPNIIEELLITFQSKKPSLPVGIVAPITYYLKEPKRIWCAGIKINKFSSFTKIIGRDKIDSGQYNELIKSDGFPNAFMIKREVFRNVGLFNSNLFPIHYDEADFAERVNKKYLIFCQPKAKIWHDIDANNNSGDRARALHCYTSLRAYYCGRNRFIFQRMYSKNWQFILFSLVFNYLVTLYYIKVILFSSKRSINKRLDAILYYLKGVVDGVQLRY